MDPPATAEAGERAGLEAPKLSARAEATLIAGLFERLPIVSALNLAVAAGMLLVFAGRQPPLVLGAWLLLMLLTLALRLHFWRRFQHRSDDASATPTWARRFTLGAAATGAAWGLAAVLFYAPQSWVAQVFLPATETSGQETLGDRVERRAVLRTRETVALVLPEEHPDRHLVRPGRVHHLVCF